MQQQPVWWTKWQTVTDTNFANLDVWPQQAGIRKLSSLTWKITPTSNCPLNHLIQAILLTSRIHKSQLTKHYNYLVRTLEDDKGSAQRWWADWPNAGLLKTENHSHDDRLVAWVWVWVWAWMWVWVWVWVCVCVRMRMCVWVWVRARGCVCVCTIWIDVKLLILQGVTGVPGGSVTNEDTSPGPV